MNSTERYDRGRTDENDIEEVDNDENGKEIKDQNGREKIGVKVQEETSELNGKVKRVRVKEEVDKVDKVKEEEDGVEKVEEEVDAALESRLSDRGKPWISTIYNTGKPFFSAFFLLTH